jgi:hypothetical protein
MSNPKPLNGIKKEKAEKFFGELIEILLVNNLPFMIGGTYAFSAYTGIDRPTKDMDIRCAFEDYPRILKVFSEAGLRTEISEEQWIAKVHHPHESIFTDVIFGEKNGLTKIDANWLKRARPGKILGHFVKLEPIEDMIRSKIYIQHRERFDGADVMNLILQYGKTLDWEFLISNIEPHWELLFAHLVNFIFVYPSEKKVIPQRLLKNYLKRAQEEFLASPQKEKITRGLLISSQYEPAVTKWGFKPIHEMK